MFPFTKFAWCKTSSDHQVPSARPVTKIGGQACCDTDFCNKNLTITLWDYRNLSNIVQFNETGADNFIFHKIVTNQK